MVWGRERGMVSAEVLRKVRLMSDRCKCFPCHHPAPCNQCGLVKLHWSVQQLQGERVYFYRGALWSKAKYNRKQVYTVQCMNK